MKKIVITIELKEPLKLDGREDRRELCDLVAEDLAAMDYTSRFEELLSGTEVAKDMSAVRNITVKIE